MRIPPFCIQRPKQARFHVVRFLFYSVSTRLVKKANFRSYFTLFIGFLTRFYRKSQQNNSVLLQWWYRWSLLYFFSFSPYFHVNSHKHICFLFTFISLSNVARVFFRSPRQQLVYLYFAFFIKRIFLDASGSEDIRSCRWNCCQVIFIFEICCSL